MKTKTDASLILEAVFDGIQSEYPRRLDQPGRDAIRPGHVYVVQMGAASGITRWTDGLTRKKTGGSRRRGPAMMSSTCYIIDDPKVCKKVAPNKPWVRKVYTFRRTILGQSTEWKIIAYDFEGKAKTRFRKVRKALSALRSPSPSSPPSSPPPPPLPQSSPLSVPLLFWPPAVPSRSPPGAPHPHPTTQQSPTPHPDLQVQPAQQPNAAASHADHQLGTVGGNPAPIVAPLVDSSVSWTYNNHPSSLSEDSPVARFTRPLFSQFAASTSTANAPISTWHDINAPEKEAPLSLRSPCEFHSRTGAGAWRAAERRPEDTLVLSLFR